MILQRIQLDFPYFENYEEIRMIQEMEHIDYNMARYYHYLKTWSKNRIEFWKSTKCITMTLEHLAFKMKTNCLKEITIQLKKGQEKPYYENEKGICKVTVAGDIEDFFVLDSHKKKEYIVEKIIEGLRCIKENIEDDLTPLTDACATIKKNNYECRWYWKKPIKKGKLYAQMLIEQDINESRLNVVFFDSEMNILQKTLITTDYPSGLKIGEHLYIFQWETDREVTIMTKNGEKITVSLR